MNEFQFRVDIPNFNEDLNIKEFLDWVVKCNKIKECMNITKKDDKTNPI
jgi:hypothetical protein